MPCARRLPRGRVRGVAGRRRRAAARDRGPAPAGPRRRRGGRRPGRRAPGPRRRADDRPRERPRRRRAADADAGGRPLPRRERDEDVRRHGRPAARRRGQARARGPGRALAPRGRPERRARSPCASCSTTRAACSTSPPTWLRRPGVPRPAARLVAARDRRRRDRAPARVRARRGLGVLGHELLRARADRRGRDRAPARHRAAQPDPRAAAPPRDEPARRPGHRRAARARLLPPAARPT